MAARKNHLKPIYSIIPSYLPLIILVCFTSGLTAKPRAETERNSMLPNISPNLNASLEISDERFLDAAPWARIESWDPARLHGARAASTEEFHGDDVSPGLELIANKKGYYLPPIQPDGRCSIGLAWPARRTLVRLSLELDPASQRPTQDEIHLEYWQGPSAWQGQWMPLKGRFIQISPQKWDYILEPAGIVTQKVRWIFSNVSSPLKAKKLTAFTPSPLEIAEIMILAENKPAGSEAAIRISNGAITTHTGQETACVWDLQSTLTLDLLYAKPTRDAYSKADRTLIHFQMSDKSFAVAVDDVLHRGPVYLQQMGIYLSSLPLSKGLEDLKRTIATRKTILQSVQEMPEQTCGQAMAKTHYDPRLNDGAVMLSLACDNEKFIVEKNGSLSYHENFVTIIHKQGEWPRELPPLYRMFPRYGDSFIDRATQDWGHLGIDAPASTVINEKALLRIQDKTYEKGLGHHANGEIVINLNGEFDRFECETGIQWGNSGSVVFQVLVDGKGQFYSGVMRMNDPAKPVSISVAGASSLLLRANDSGDGIASDLANWADARLFRKPGAAPEYLSDMAGNKPAFQRHMEDGWLPAPVSVTEANGIRYSQRSFVVPSAEKESPFQIGGKPLAVIQIDIQNMHPKAAKAAVQLQFSPGSAVQEPISIGSCSRRFSVESGGRLLAVIDPGDQDVRDLKISGPTWGWSAQVPAHYQGQIMVYLPAWNLPSHQDDEISWQGTELFSRFTQYWIKIMGAAAQIETPDEWLTNLIRASQVHIYMAGRNEDNGARVVPWIASRSYPHAIDSEGNSVIRAMVLFGHSEFARGSFDFFFSRYKPEGYMTTGYTLLGSGWHLRTLAEHVRLAGDYEWFRQRAALPLKMCRWIMAQRRKTKLKSADAGLQAAHGLMPPGKVADWNIFAHYFYGEGQYCSGLKAMGELLKGMGYPEGEECISDAAEYAEAIQAAFAYAQSNAPAVPLRNGAWVPFHPFAVHAPGRVDDLYRDMQDAFVNNWLYDVELGAQQLAVFGLIPPSDPRIADMLNDMEDNLFLRDGARAYPSAMNQADWFNMGGFGKAQPYYAQIPEIYALRDEVKPFLRSYFNTLASQLNEEVLTIYEGFTPACINKTHETGYFLVQTRNMLAMERGQELWLASLAPRDWFQDGRNIEVRNLPTEFGPVSYRVHSAVADGFIEAQITPPTRSLPKAIVLRLRHPEGKPIEYMEVNDGIAAEVDPDRETVRFISSGYDIRAKARY